MSRPVGIQKESVPSPAPLAGAMLKEMLLLAEMAVTRVLGRMPGPETAMPTNKPEVLETGTVLVPVTVVAARSWLKVSALPLTLPVAAALRVTPLSEMAVMRVPGVMPAPLTSIFSYKSAVLAMPVMDVVPLVLPVRPTRLDELSARMAEISREEARLFCRMTKSLIKVPCTPVTSEPEPSITTSVAPMLEDTMIPPAWTRFLPSSVRRRTKSPESGVKKRRVLAS